MPEKNNLFLSGKVLEIEDSTHIMILCFYRFLVKVPRLSGNYDILPVIVSEKILYNNEIKVGEFVSLEGQIRTQNYTDKGRKRVLVFGYALNITKIDEEEHNKIEDKNLIALSGFVVKKPIFRETGSGRKISELLVASNRNHNRSDYIPSISWGLNAVFSSRLEIGSELSLTGRFQSRNYTARGEDNNSVTKTAYEVSVLDIGVLEG